MVEVRSIAPLGAAPPVGGDHARVDPASPVPMPTAAPRIPVRRRRRGRWTRARLRRSRDRRRDAPPAHGLASAGSGGLGDRARRARDDGKPLVRPRSEEHTSELQSRLHLVCRLLLEKKKKTTYTRLTPQPPHIIFEH